MTGAPPAASAGWTIAVSSDVSEAGYGAILSGLVADEEASVGSAQHAPVSVYVANARDGIVGGLQGRTFYGWLIVELLFLPPACRGLGIGARVLREAEAEAVRRGCRGARVETSSFGAYGFYARQGYAAFGELALGFGGHRLVFMRKELGAGGA